MKKVYLRGLRRVPDVDYTFVNGKLKFHNNTVNCGDVIHIDGLIFSETIIITSDEQALEYMRPELFKEFFEDVKNLP